MCVCAARPAVAVHLAAMYLKVLLCVVRADVLAQGRKHSAACVSEAVVLRKTAFLVAQLCHLCF